METLIGLLTNNVLLSTFGPIAVILMVVCFIAYRNYRLERIKNDQLNDQRVADVKESNDKYQALVEKIQETLQKFIPGAK